MIYKGLNDENYIGRTDYESVLLNYSKNLHSIMLDTRLQPFATLQQTDESAILERSISGMFVTKQLNNFATVSTTTLVVHKSGNCII